MWTRRTAALLAVLLVLGLAAGYLLGTVLPSPAPRDRAAEPLVAEPAVPGDPVVVLSKDPTEPPLATDLAMTRARLGEGRYLTSFPVPKGWTRTSDIANEGTWKPTGYPSNTHVLRVEQVLSQHETVEHILTTRIGDLRLSTWQFELLERTANTLEFTYVSPADRHLRHGFLVWLDVSGEGFAEMEIAVTGRAVDRDGAAALVDRVASGTRLVG
jgi:hypothetical protein